MALWSVVFGLPAFGSIAERYRLLGIARGRAEESICTFARSFGRREADPRVIRAVYEELQRYTWEVAAFPVRASDDLYVDLHIPAEDLDFALTPAIAQRVGRTLPVPREGSCCSQVRTAGELVRFLSGQPRYASATA